jgi:hypothetical protein
VARGAMNPAATTSVVKIPAVTNRASSARIIANQPSGLKSLHARRKMLKRRPRHPHRQNEKFSAP